MSDMIRIDAPSTYARYRRLRIRLALYGATLIPLTVAQS